MSEVPRVPMSGDVLGGKYILRDRLGAGGMGVVFCADDPALARTVAVKVMHPALVADPKIARRFQDEVVAASRLSHPNVVGVIDVGTTGDGTPYFVMEHVHGDTLARILRAAGPLELHRAVGFVGQILAALDEAHAAGIVHGDVKCDNVLVESLRDGAELVKMVDFGLARLAWQTGAPPRHVPATTGEVVVSGTAEYMAPELARGEPASPATDLYAAGVILYELITGATPFGGGAFDEILSRHVHDDLVPPSLRCPERIVPAAIDRVIVRALAKDPRARFPDAAAFSSALAAAAPAPGNADLRRCHACGEQAPIGTPFCPECGAFAVAPPPAVASAETSTEPWATIDPIALAAPPTPVEREARARAEVGVAIARGDVDAIALGYLTLARTLVSVDRIAGAIEELEEGILLLTAGAGAEAPDGPPPLWQLLVALAALQDARGAIGPAQRSALAAYHHAIASRSAIGRDRARAILDRLAVRSAA